MAHLLKRNSKLFLEVFIWRKEELAQFVPAEFFKIPDPYPPLLIAWICHWWVLRDTELVPTLIKNAPSQQNLFSHIIDEAMETSDKLHLYQDLKVKGQIQPVFRYLNEFGWWNNNEFISVDYRVILKEEERYFTNVGGDAFDFEPAIEELLLDEY
jgi:hypothetical protein